jgi:hypothetical protein
MLPSFGGPPLRRSPVAPLRRNRASGLRYASAGHPPAFGAFAGMGERLAAGAGHRREDQPFNAPTISKSLCDGSRRITCRTVLGEYSGRLNPDPIPQWRKLALKRGA